MSKRSAGLITPATFRALREACGLTQDETGVYMASTLRTVQNWEAGQRGIPDNAVKSLRDLDQKIRDCVSAMVMPLSESDEAQTVTLIRYKTDEAYAGTHYDLEATLPRQAHNAMLWRAMDAITRLGHEYTMEWAEGTERNP